MRSMPWYEPALVVAVAGSAAYCHVKTTSSAVNGRPSCQATPRFSRHTTDLPSRATPPLAMLGVSAARTGTTVPSVSMSASGS
jgi:hypothetical protein